MLCPQAWQDVETQDGSNRWLYTCQMLTSHHDHGQLQPHLLMGKGREFLNHAVLAAGEIQLISPDWQDGDVIANNPTAPILQPHASDVSRINSQAAAGEARLNLCTEIPAVQGNSPGDCLISAINRRVRKADLPV